MDIYLGVNSGSMPNRFNSSQYSLDKEILPLSILIDRPSGMFSIALNLASAASSNASREITREIVEEAKVDM